MFQPDEVSTFLLYQYMSLSVHEIKLNGVMNEEKDRPLLITLKEEQKKRQLFQNLNKIREAGEPFQQSNYHS